MSSRGITVKHGSDAVVDNFSRAERKVDRGSKTAQCADASGFQFLSLRVVGVSQVRSVSIR